MGMSASATLGFGIQLPEDLSEVAEKMCDILGKEFDYEDGHYDIIYDYAKHHKLRQQFAGYAFEEGRWSLLIEETSKTAYYDCTEMEELPSVSQEQRDLIHKISKELELETSPKWLLIADYS